MGLADVEKNQVVKDQAFPVNTFWKEDRRSGFKF